MLPFLFQNVEKASYSVFIFFADYLRHEGTQLIVDGEAKTKSYNQYLEIEIARRRNGRVDRPGLDDDNATSLKHGNEAFLDYMLDSVFVGSK